MFSSTTFTAIAKHISLMNTIAEWAGVDVDDVTCEQNGDDILTYTVRIPTLTLGKCHTSSMDVISFMRSKNFDAHLIVFLSCGQKVSISFTMKRGE